MKKEILIQLFLLCVISSCAFQKEIDLSIIHDEKMKDHVHYGITIRSDGDTIIHSSYSVKVHFFERLDGKFIQFRNNIIVNEFNVKGGKKQGEFRVFYPNGKLQRRGNYINGELDGKIIVFYENGMIEKELYFKMGEASGIWKYWNEFGELTRIKKHS